MKKTIPTQIVDKNGKPTTVHRSIPEASAPARNRIPAIKSISTIRREKAEKAASVKAARKALDTALVRFKEIRTGIVKNGMEAASESIKSMPDETLNSLIGLAAVITQKLQDGRDTLSSGNDGNGQRITSITIDELYDISFIRASRGWSASEEYIAAMPRAKRESLTLVSAMLTRHDQLQLPKGVTV